MSRLRLTTTPELVTAAAHVGPVATAGSTSLSADAQWQRVSSIVERSVERAQSIGAQQSAARQQLDAAEYTLHRLIEELNEVMAAPMLLPKRVAVAAPAQEQVFVQALAA
jgi:prophage DNA circulation protein